MFSMNHCIL